MLFLVPVLMNDRKPVMLLSQSNIDSPLPLFAPGQNGDHPGTLADVGFQVRFEYAGVLGAVVHHYRVPQQREGIDGVYGATPGARARRQASFGRIPLCVVVVLLQLGFYPSGPNRAILHPIPLLLLLDYNFSAGGALARFHPPGLAPLLDLPCDDVLQPALQVFEHLIRQRGAPFVLRREFLGQASENLPGVDDVRHHGIRGVDAFLALTDCDDDVVLDRDLRGTLRSVRTGTGGLLGLAERKAALVVAGRAALFLLLPDPNLGPDPLDVLLRLRDVLVKPLYRRKELLLRHGLLVFRGRRRRLLLVPLFRFVRAVVLRRIGLAVAGSAFGGGGLHRGGVGVGVGVAVRPPGLRRTPSDFRRQGLPFDRRDASCGSGRVAVRVQGHGSRREPDEGRGLPRPIVVPGVVVVGLRSGGRQYNREGVAAAAAAAPVADVTRRHR
mmetsp:Transcript_28454/g.69370  ORF Transcript_28454/g.69370 Transcript_28454/m.69370 type:complete len:441 (+) Transcript_28454:971-2293(+)